MCPIHVCTMEHVLEWITTHSNVFAWGAGKENVVMVSEDFKSTRFYLLQYSHMLISLHLNTFIKSVSGKHSYRSEDEKCEYPVHTLKYIQ